MAKSKTIKLSEGEILLKGFTPEAMEAIEKAIRGGSEANIQVQKAVSGELPDIALGITYDKKERMFKMVEIKFNHLTKESELINISDVGEYRAFATNNFKIALVKYNLV